MTVTHVESMVNLNIVCKEFLKVQFLSQIFGFLTIMQKLHIGITVSSNFFVLYTGVCKVKAMAMKHGHTVVFLPPYRPELNAIETAWAVVKNHVARHNHANIRFADLHSIILDGFRKVALQTWVQLDAKVVKEEKDQLQQLREDKHKAEAFREQHPDLSFNVGSESGKY